MASNKEKLTQNIKGWLQVDKEIQVLQKELKDRKKKKNDYANTLMQTMKANEIDCFDTVSYTHLTLPTKRIV